MFLRKEDKTNYPRLFTTVYISKMESVIPNIRLKSVIEMRVSSGNFTVISKSMGFQNQHKKASNTHFLNVLRLFISRRKEKDFPNRPK